MKTVAARILLIACILLTACSHTKGPKENLNVEVSAGTYISNDPANLSLPASGYTVYFLGEVHGNRETKQVFQTYLKSLYEKAGLRDVILEEDQAFETDANAYVHGQTDSLADGLCLRADILSQIREFNATLPEDQKVDVHLVDVDSPMPIVYKHVQELYQQLGPAASSITLPSQSDFKTGASKQRFALVDELKKAAADQPEILHELETVNLSLQWYALGNRMDTGQAAGMRSTFGPLREDILTHNVQYVVEHLNGKPILAFFGGSHGMKDTTGLSLPGEGFKTWAQDLTEAGIPVYSLFMDGVGGEGYWRDETITYGEGVEQYTFANGSTIVSLFDTYSDATLIYTDLRNPENQNIQLPVILPGAPASKAFDGFILFKEFTPMEDACNQ